VANHRKEVTAATSGCVRQVESAWHASEKFRLYRPADGRVDEDLIAKL
jgi:hypothetical protein